MIALIVFSIWASCSTFFAMFKISSCAFFLVSSSKLSFCAESAYSDYSGIFCNCNMQKQYRILCKEFDRHLLLCRAGSNYKIGLFSFETAYICPFRRTDRGIIQHFFCKCHNFFLLSTHKIMLIAVKSVKITAKM